MILLINDDGIDAPGLRALYQALRRSTGQAVLAVVPTIQRSGQSHAITLDRGLSVSPKLDEGMFAFAIDGTPTDCVKLALKVLCPEPPELVVSGVNDGPNVGRSLLYSGTVGAAMEAAVEGFAALAVSRDLGPGSFADAAEFAAVIAQQLLGRSEFKGQVVNLNLPATPASAWRPARLAAHGHSGFSENYRPVREAKERIAWQLSGEWVAVAGDGDSDAHLLRAGHPVLSVLTPDFNGDHRLLKRVLTKTAARGKRKHKAGRGR